MSRSACRSVLTLVTFALALGTQALSQSPGFPSPKNGDWPHYTGDIRGSKYSPLDQINASNFNKLEVAWRFKTDNFGTFPEYKLEGTPLAIRGVLYTTAGTRRDVIALDGRTGELVFELVARLHREHQLTSLIATHNLAFARRCHRVLRLDQGKMEEVAPESLPA